MSDTPAEPKTAEQLAIFQAGGHHNEIRIYDPQVPSTYAYLIYIDHGENHRDAFIDTANKLINASILRATEPLEKRVNSAERLVEGIKREAAHYKEQYDKAWQALGLKDDDVVPHDAVGELIKRVKELEAERDKLQSEIARWRQE
jgi:hypothetical protein